MNFKYNIKPNILSDNFKILVIDLTRIKNIKDILKLLELIKKYNTQYWSYLIDKQLLYANQYNFKLKNKDSNQSLNEFKESYKPKYIFNRGVLKMYHDDLNPNIKSK